MVAYISVETSLMSLSHEQPTETTPEKSSTETEKAEKPILSQPFPKAYRR